MLADGTGGDELPRFLWGRYVKLCNDMPQSPWLIGDVRKGKSSVHEVIANGIARAGVAARAESVKFHAAGREDIDVRMLGNGRPFMLDLGDGARVRQALKLEVAARDGAQELLRARRVALLAAGALRVVHELGDLRGERGVWGGRERRL